MSQNQSDSSKELEAAGFNIEKMSPEQRQILSSLSPEEVDVLVRTKKRLDSASDVQGYMMGDGNGNFYY